MLQWLIAENRLAVPRSCCSEPVDLRNQRIKLNIYSPDQNMGFNHIIRNIKQKVHFSATPGQNRILPLLPLAVSVRKSGSVPSTSVLGPKAVWIAGGHRRSHPIPIRRPRHIRRPVLQTGSTAPTDHAADAMDQVPEEKRRRNDGCLDFFCVRSLERPFARADRDITSSSAPRKGEHATSWPTGMGPLSQNPVSHLLGLRHLKERLAYT